MGISECESKSQMAKNFVQQTFYHHPTMSQVTLKTAWKTESYSAFEMSRQSTYSYMKSKNRMLRTGWTRFCVIRTKFLFGDYVSATPSTM